MTELTTKKKKEWAAMLYLKESLTQAEIADKVGVSKVTMSKWVVNCFQNFVSLWSETTRGWLIERRFML
jgi:DNA-binding transcriptional regulator LsrR (DeoR family)